MSGITPRPKWPWCSLASLSIVLYLLATIRFLSTPEGQHWVEDFFQPLGDAAILLGVAGPLLFLGLSGAVLILAVSGVVRHEAFRLGELALTIVFSLFLQIASAHAEVWSGYPLRLLIAGVIVFGVGSGVRWFLHLVRPRAT